VAASGLGIIMGLNLLEVNDKPKTKLYKVRHVTQTLLFYNVALGQFSYPWFHGCFFPFNKILEWLFG
jgi:hypothetical protein